ncbi:Secreted RxLR effector peptide protein [Phytophthora palmivora]|uniref:Secreted RxLR effector peptide protein n=1 Tax=Phytophthora palmivora TaxID=4796 RepID=A0A2P4YG23_9STRA|nr:Secreted RxLR effector peptide protein [Phytophthora palmivora]
MSIIRVLLITFLACGNAIFTASSSEQPATLTGSEQSYSVLAGEQRSLRVDKADLPADETSEEKSFLAYTKVRWWLETGKSDDYVRKALKLNGLDDATMKTRKNYRYYEYFARKALEYQIYKWLNKKYTTFNIWTEMGFHDVVLKTSDDLVKLLNTANGNTYNQYVKKADFYAGTSLKAGYKPSISMDSYATEAEKIARTTIMANSQTKDAVAKVLLGLTVPGKTMMTLQGDALKKHRGYQYFEYFQNLKALDMKDKQYAEKSEALFQKLKSLNAANAYR